MSRLAVGAPAATLFAVIDGAQFPDIGTQLALLDGGSSLSLFSGRQGHELRDVAPYLVWHEHAPVLLTWFLHLARTQPAGFLVVAAAPAGDLRRHFAAQLTVALRDGRHVFFRFYDPRVLASSFDVLRPDQLRELLGPCQRVLAVDAEGRSLIARSLDDVGAVSFSASFPDAEASDAELAAGLLQRYPHLFAVDAAH